MSNHPIRELKEQTWEKFFEGSSINWERIYQVFEARRKAETKKRATKTSGTEDIVEVL